MSEQTRLYDPVYRYLQQGSEFVDKRHLQVLSWIVTALLVCQRLNPSAWEPYVTSRAEKAQSYQRRWSRFFDNSRVLVFRTEELYLDSKSSVFELERSKIRDAGQLDRLYIGAAIALLFATLTGMAVQKEGLRQQVDPHWKRGLSYLKMGLRWLAGVVHKGRPLLPLSELLLHDPARCFASRKAKEKFFNQFFFSRVRTVSSSA